MNTSDGKEILAKLLLQQCLSAKLQVKPPNDDLPAEYVEISRGMVVYVCFMKGANLETVDKMINIVTSVKLSQNAEGKLTSVLELPGSILIVPQATLGGKLKGKRMQYHSNIEKSAGLKLYEKFTEGCQQALAKNTKKTNCFCGTYGNLQVLSINTNGPYTHAVDIT